MWSCKRGHKNSNGSTKCHGAGCNEYQPMDAQIKVDMKKRKMEKQKDIMGKKISGERMTRSVMKLFGGSMK